MKNKSIIYLILIFLISAIFIHPLFQFKFYKTHDGEAHAARFAAYYQAFVDGQIPPRWAGKLNYGYGTPIFIFYYPLPEYLGILLHIINLTYEKSFILLMIISFILAPIFFYLWLKEYFKIKIAFMGALFFALIPYHFLNTFVRGDIAENLAFVFIPLVLLFIEKFNHSNKIIFIIAGSVAYALLILSHNGIGLMFSPIIFIYSLLRIRNKKILLANILIFILGLVLSCYFWLPALVEGKFVNSNLFIGYMYRDHFPGFLQLIYSSWGYGPDINKPGGLSAQIGYLYTILLIISIFCLNKYKEKRLIIFWILVFILSIFITLPVSGVFWEKLSILRLYEFPWRFTAASSFAAVILICYLLNKFNSKIFYAICLICLIISSMQFVKVIGYQTNKDSYYDNYKGTTDYQGQAISVWTEGNPWNTAKSKIELIGGRASISNIKIRTNLHTFHIDAKTKAQLLDNTIYFPGWIVKVDGIKVPIEFQDMNHRGMITFYIPQGRHDIELIFTESPVRIVADTISLLGILIMLLLMYLSFKKKRL